MRTGNSRFSIDWGHLALLALIAGTATWYLLDARAVSLSVNNLLLVQPTALFVIGMVLLIIPQCFRSERPAAEEKTAGAEPARPQSEMIRIAAVGLSLAAFVFLIEPIGFDAAMFLFILATMAICGERRPLPLMIYPLAVTLILVSGFKQLMPYPMTTLVL